MTNATLIDPAAVDLPPTQSIDITALGSLNSIPGATAASTQQE